MNENENETKIRTHSNEAYEEAIKRLHDAEVAMKDPCVEEAAWAVYEGRQAESQEVIAKAEKIINDYFDAIDCLKACISPTVDTPD